MQKKLDYIELNNGEKIPYNGFGTGKVNIENFDETIKKAINAGYRHFDTGSSYNTEEYLGKSLLELFNKKIIHRSDIYITTKIYNNEKNDVLLALKNSLKKLNMDYIDFYLIHWPIGFLKNGELIQEPLYKTWKQMENCINLGLCKSIGLSNFNATIILDLLSYCQVKPTINQIEMHPFFQQNKLVNFCKKMNITVVAYSPFTRNYTNVLSNLEINEISKKYKKKPSQVILNWIHKNNIASIERSENFDHMKENLSSDDFEIEQNDLLKLEKLNINQRIFDLKNIYDFDIFDN